MDLHVRTCASVFNISGTAGRILLKFCPWLLIHYMRDIHKSEVGCTCTCSRPHPFSISRKRLGGLRSNLVCVAMDPLYDRFTQVSCGCICTCAREHPFRMMVSPRPLVYRQLRRHTDLWLWTTRERLVMAVLSFLRKKYLTFRDTSAWDL